MIDFDYTNVSQEIIGSEDGIDIDFEFSNYSQKISNIVKNIQQNKDIINSDYKFLNFSTQKEQIEEIKEYALSVKEKFDDICVIGIGSPLFGMRLVSETILTSFWNTMSNEERNGFPRIHFLDNIDPDNISSFTTVKDIKKTLLIIISRQGLRADTMAIFMLAKNTFEKELGNEYVSNIVVCTEEGSLLYQIASQEGYKCFVMQRDTITRFSTLSPSALLPVILTGIDINELLKGAEEGLNHSLNPNIYENKSAQTALIHYLLYSQKNKSISVTMPYSFRLKRLPSWCTHVKGQSLSKTIDLNGRINPVSQIPFSAYGCVDQYSMLQMFIEGTRNKLVNIVKVKNFETDKIIPKIFGYTGIGYLGGKTISELLEAEINAMTIVLTDNHCPNMTVTIPEISPFFIGYFISSYMVNILIQAELYNINPFSSPAIESLHDYVCAQMGQFGYEETSKEINEKLLKFRSKLVLPE